MLFFRGRMRAGEREDRRMRWQAWHTAALPLMKTFPNALAFIDPDAAAKADRPGAGTFLALRGLGGAQPPDWVLEKFGLLSPTS